MTEKAGRFRYGIALALATALLTGCVDADATKAGHGAAPITLHLATVELSNVVYGPDVAAFAGRVADLSNGRLRIKIDWQMLGWGTGTEAKLVKAVEKGESDLALLPTRAFADAGIHGFDALQAPFLIDSPELATAVTRGPIASRMLGHLGPNLVGLGVGFESFRHPLSYSTPIATLSDFAGLRVRVVASSLGPMFAALGATAVVSAEYDHDDHWHALQAADGAYAWSSGFPPVTVMTANVTTYTKFNAIVATKKSWDGLGAADRDVLKRAAREFATRTGDDPAAAEAGALADYCATGRRLALATESAVGTMVAATQPVLASLERDPETARDIDAIRAARSTITNPTPLPVACRSRAGDSAPWPRP